MDLAELEAQAAQLQTIEDRLESMWAIRQGRCAQLEAHAFADNADAEAGSSISVVTATTYIDVSLDYPHLPDDRIIEIGEARRQLEEAASRLADAKRAREVTEAEFSQVRDRIIEQEVAEQKEGAVHWDRRFHTSLAIGHGAAFAAIVNHVFDKDTAPLAVRVSLPAVLIFGLGLLLSGAIPGVRAVRPDPMSKVKTLAQASRSRVLADLLANSSAALFAAGLLAAAWGAGVVAFPGEAARFGGAVQRMFEPASKSAPGAQTKPVSPPASPTAPAAVSPPPSRLPGTLAPQPQKSEPQDVAPQGAADRKGDLGQ